MSGDELILRIAMYTAYVMGFGGAALIVAATPWWARGGWRWRAQELERLGKEREASTRVASRYEWIAVFGPIRRKRFLGLLEK